MKSNQTNTLKKSIDICPIWSMEATDKVGKMIEQIEQGNALLRAVSEKWQDNKNKVAIQGGFAAETWHAESFNLDAILKDKNVRAFTDNFKGNHGLSKNNAVHDIVVMDGNQQILTAQSKY